MVTMFEFYEKIATIWLENLNEWRNEMLTY